MKRIWQRMITTFFLTVLLYSIINLGSISYDYLTNRMVLADVKQIYYQDDRSERQIDEKDGVVSSSFSDLLAINEDIVGWINIEDTLIDYPVLQAQDNEFYLNRNYKQEDTRAGSIFLDYRSDINESPAHTILYGHRMKDSSMFSGLTKFMDEDFFAEPPAIYFDTLYDQYDVEIFAAYQTHTDFYYIETEFEDDQVYEQFLNNIQEKSMFKSDLEVTTEDQIITFSTCDYSLHPTEGRLVVHGKLVKR